MTEAGRIADQLRRAFEGPAWHGPSVLEALETVDAARAAAHPVPNVHSIWEIVLHLTTWDDVIRRRLGGEVVRSEDAADWPEVGEATEAGWREALARLRRGHQALHATLLALDDATLDQPPYPGSSTRYVSAHGQVQHNLYHAGQIMLLRRTQEAS